MLSAVKADINRDHLKDRKMIRSLIYAVCVVLVVFATYLVAGVKKPDAQLLWRYISYHSPYTSWESWAGGYCRGIKGSCADAMVRIYSNFSEDKKSKHFFGSGTIAVKECHNNEGEISSISVMSRVKGYNPENGDWFWAKYTADGDIVRQGKVSGCIGCHQSADGGDFLFSADGVYGKKKYLIRKTFD